MRPYIVFSDLHLHTWSYGSHTNSQGYNSRLWAQFEALMNMKDYALQHDIKDIFFCGDLFHTHSNIPTQVLAIATAAFMEFYKAGLNLYCIVGNHDMATQEGHIHSLGWLEPIAKVIDKEMDFEIKGTAIHAMPYTEDPEKLKGFLERSPEESILLMHQGVDGAEMGSGWVTNEIFSYRDVPDRVRTVYTGHYHRPATYTPTGKSPYLFIPGSMMQHTWGDVDSWLRGFMVATPDIPVVWQYSKAPRFVVLKLMDPMKELTSRSDIASPSGLGGINPGDFVRVADYTPEQVPLIREILFDKFKVASVEFLLSDYGVPVDVGVEYGTPHTRVEFSIEPILQEYEKLQLPKRRHELGKMLRSGQEYVAP